MAASSAAKTVAAVVRENKAPRWSHGPYGPQAAPVSPKNAFDVPLLEAVDSIISDLEKGADGPADFHRAAGTLDASVRVSAPRRLRLLAYDQRVRQRW